MTRTIRAIGLLAAAGLLLAGCTVKKQDPGDLSGPSVLATSLTMSANPDTLRQDGSSQATVTVIALDVNGQPVRNLPVRLDIAIGGVIADYGQVSARNIVTSSDGRASVVYTAPDAPADPVDNGTVVQILATPTGSDYGNALSRSVSIRLVPPGIILPPNGTPVPAFSYSPTSPISRSDVVFDASQSRDSDGQIVRYMWSFGDGESGSGVSATHQYRVGGDYAVTLTVTDDRGYSATATQTVSVADSAAPSADFVYSPTSPRPNDDIIFNASGSRPGTGRTIVSYEWDFGTGRTGSGITVAKSYATPATYTVTLVVTDDIGNEGNISKTVTVQSSPLSAGFVFSPTAPAPFQNVAFDASPSTAGSGRMIVAYDWNFGDNVFGSGRIVNHRFSTAATYVVVLTVRDDIGQTNTVTQDVKVSTGAITAQFLVPGSSMQPPGFVTLDARDSESPFGITTWTWDFGDGATGAGRTVSHQFVCDRTNPDRTYVVRLTVSDGMGRRASSIQKVVPTGCR